MGHQLRAAPAEDGSAAPEVRSGAATAAGRGYGLGAAGGAFGPGSGIAMSVVVTAPKEDGGSSAAHVAERPHRVSHR
jgi:hypothetical protein